MRRLFMPSALATAGLLLGGALAGGAGVANASAQPAATVLQPGGPMVRPATSGGEPYPTVSLNWSGYADTASKGHTFDAVSGSFVQPRITCNGKNTMTSNWVGLDGFENGTVEQDGTLAYCGGPTHTKQFYIAWIEMFPAPTVTEFRVKPGDYIDTSVTYSGGAFHLTVADTTSHKSATTSATCSQCQRQSAEWIIERPASCNSTVTKCLILKLADFHETAMDNDYAQLSGGPVKGPGGFTNYPVDMVSQFRHKAGFISLDEVSGLSGPNFSVLWNRSGSTYPITF